MGVTTAGVVAGGPSTIGKDKSGHNQLPSLKVRLLTAGSAACVADLVTFPLDTAKVRLQIQGEATKAGGSIPDRPAMYRGVLGTIRTIVKNEGARGLYNGLVPGLQRQMAFSAIRIGAYETVRDYYRNRTKAESGVGMLLVRICAGITTGTMAILLAQPTDVVKVQMQAEVRGKSGCQSRRYKGVMDAYSTIARTEGLRGLYKGTAPNIVRNSVVNIGEIVVYDMVKEAIITRGLMEDHVPCHLASAVVAGFCATLVASPVDVIKTRYMNSLAGTYSGALGCAIQTARLEGLPAFYKGFSASFTRLVSWNVCLWVTYEQFKLMIGD